MRGAEDARVFRVRRGRQGATTIETLTEQWVCRRSVDGTAHIYPPGRSRLLVRSVGLLGPCKEVLAGQLVKIAAAPHLETVPALRKGEK